MPKESFIQKIKNALNIGNCKYRKLLLELAELQENMRLSLEHIDASQRDIAETLVDIKGCILSLKKSHNCKDCKRCKHAKSKVIEDVLPQ